MEQKASAVLAFLVEVKKPQFNGNTSVWNLYFAFIEDTTATAHAHTVGQQQHAYVLTIDYDECHYDIDLALIYINT